MDAGERVAERFEILAEAGSGGMGTVYRARDHLSGELVALKVLRSSEETDVRRFSREATVLAELSHPAIVRYVAHGTTARGRIYLAMEWLQGKTLAERHRESPLSLADSLDLIGVAARALGAAHDRGIVHRDVKPSNLFLVDEQPAHVKVLDFGIARFRASGHTVTTTGGVVGTPQYMAPEQARSHGSIDGRADLYALGAVLFELLTGVPPFSGDSLIAVLAAVLLEETPRPCELRDGVPDSVDQLVHSLLQKDPARRPADAAQLLSALDALGDVTGVATSPSLLAPVLTDSERRMLCVIMTAPVRDWGASAPTLRTDEQTATDARVREVVEARGGNVEFLSDGSIVATVAGVGSPNDHAARAAECALAMRGVLERVPMALVAGRGAMSGRLPVGDVIHRAVELLDPAARRTDRVCVDDNIAGFLAGRAAVEREGSALYLSDRPIDRDTSRQLLGRPVPFVGRRRELTTLEGLLDECFDEPVARAAVLTGPAGSGKSRLVRELLGRACNARADLTVLRGGADPMRDGSPFAALSSAIRAASSIADGEPLEDRRRKLRSRIARTVPAGELPSVLPFLGELARVPFDAADDGALSAARQDARLMGDSMRKAFEDWLGHECAAAPVLIVLEDLHFGDPPTVAFVDAALRHLEDAPLFVLATGRPEVLERFPGMWADRDVQELRLGRLTKRAAAELVRSILEGAQDSLVDRLVERAEGNPFFLEELIRSVSERGEGRLPETIVAMMQARLEALPAETRRVLRAASVFGAAFWESAVGSLVGDGTPVADHLPVLAGRELIVRRSRSAFPDESEWTFAHALVHDAAYAALTDEDRRLGHRLAGEWLEERGAPDAFVLAEHYRRGDRPEWASRWFATAAEQALEANDFAEAERRCELGLSSCGPADSVRGQLLLCRAEACRWRARYEESLAHATAASDCLTPGSVQWFAAIGDAVSASGRLGLDAEVLRWADRAACPVATDGARRAQLVCACRIAAELFGIGRYERAADALEEVVAVAGHDPVDPIVRAWVCTLRASQAARGGDLARYLRSTELAATAYEEASDLRHATNQRVRLGYGLLEAGQHARAESVLVEARAGAARLGTPLIEAYALQNLGHARGCLGRLDEARQAQGRAQAIADGLGDAVAAAGARFHLAHSLLEAGDASGAVLEASRAVEALPDESPMAPVASAMLARALIRTGDAERALQLTTRSADRIAHAEGHSDGDALVRLAHAEALVAAGRRSDAARVVGDARRSLEARAEAIADDALRRSFLTAVPEHRDTLALAGELGA